MSQDKLLCSSISTKPVKKGKKPVKKLKNQKQTFLKQE